MKEWLPTIIGSGGVVLGGIAMFILNFLKGARAEKEASAKAKAIALESLDKAQGDLLLVIKEEVEAWKARHKFEHEELVNARASLEEYRTTAHAKRNEMNKQVLDLTVEIAECRAKTDMTPIYKHHHEQGLINKKMIESLDISLRSLKAITRHLDIKTNGNGGTPA